MEGKLVFSRPIEGRLKPSLLFQSLVHLDLLRFTLLVGQKWDSGMKLLIKE